MIRTVMFTLLLVLSGCASAPPPMTASDVSMSGYRLDAGDKLRVTVYGEQRLTGEYSISPSGSIAFPLIGTVAATNLTTDQLGQMVTKRLAAGYLNDPRVAVEVINYRPYYIFGEVTRPGEYPFVNGRTVEQAIAAAGGFTYRGNSKRVTLRRGSQGERLVKPDFFTARVMPGDTIHIGERYF